jgi:NADPH2:quinone reductase
VAISVAYAGINFKDIMARRGDAGYAPRWPFVPGVEVSGTVVEQGSGVTHPRVGDRVVALTNEGGLAEVVSAQAALTVPVPPELPLADAVVAPGALTTAVLLHDHVARIRAGDVVLVHSAAGAVGRALADVARAGSGARLIGVVGASSRIDAAHRAGYADVVVRGDSLAVDVRAVLADRGVDVVLDPQGTAFLGQDIELLAPGGRIVLFGNASGAPLAALPATGSLYGRNAAIGGFSLAAFSAHAPEAVASALRVALDLLARGLTSTEVTVLPDLAAAMGAQQALADGTGKGKYVVSVAPSSGVEDSGTA